MLASVRTLALAAALVAGSCVHAADQLEGEPYIHDPSTVTWSDGAWYSFGTGEGGLVSTDGWTWHRGGVRPGGGVAPDVIHIGDRYYVAYAVGGGGMNGGHASDVKVMWTRSLDPISPQFGYHAVGTVASSDGHEDADAIDPAFLYAGGHLWLSYGTYFGYIRMVELDPATGARLPGNQPVNIAIDLEATALIYRDGWYYLLGTQGTCCDGPNSTYHIRVGRTRDPLVFQLSPLRCSPASIRAVNRLLSRGDDSGVLMLPVKGYRLPQHPAHQNKDAIGFCTDDTAQSTEHEAMASGLANTMASGLTKNESSSLFQRGSSSDRYSRSMLT